jgi:hypothetical protein
MSTGAPYRITRSNAGSGTRKNCWERRPAWVKVARRDRRAVRRRNWPLGSRREQIRRLTPMMRR